MLRGVDVAIQLLKLLFQIQGSLRLLGCHLAAVVSQLSQPTSIHTYSARCRISDAMSSCYCFAATAVRVFASVLCVHGMNVLNVFCIALMWSCCHTPFTDVISVAACCHFLHACLMQPKLVH
jgi:hypothetical protein